MNKHAKVDDYVRPAYLSIKNKEMPPIELQQDSVRECVSECVCVCVCVRAGHAECACAYASWCRAGVRMADNPTSVESCSCYCAWLPRWLILRVVCVCVWCAFACVVWLVAHFGCCSVAGGGEGAGCPVHGNSNVPQSGSTCRGEMERWW